MKKIVLIGLIMGMVMSLPIMSFAGTCTFDASGPSATIGHDPSVLNDFKPSKNVEVQVNAGLQSYAATADHLNGDRVFGGASGDSVIKWQSKTEGQHASGPTANDSSAFSGWSQL